MPLIHGVCVPPVCVSLDYDQTKMTLTFFDTKKGVAVPQPNRWRPQDVATALASALPTTVVECDGCACWKPFPPTPWAALPPARLNHPIVLNYKVVLDVAGVKVRSRIGICVPPGTKAKGADGEWHEIGAAGGTGSSSHPKSAGKKPKAPAKRRPRR